MNLDKVRVRFQSQEPHTTPYLKLWVPANDEPTEMYTALNKIGFKDDGMSLTTDLSYQPETNVSELRGRVQLKF